MADAATSEQLTARQARLLRLIVQEYVRTAGEVASRTLVERYQLDISPATARNEMARLEEMGYLHQPHTSAGRRPTEVGFRYFVERLMEEQSLPPMEQRMITHQFYQARDRVKEWLPLASTVLARSAQGAAVVTAPRTTRAIYKHVELIVTHGRVVLLILVLEGGSVEQRMLSLAEPMSQSALREAADRLNQAFAGCGVEEIAAQISELPALEQSIAQLITAMMGKVAQEPSGEIYYHGLSRLLQEPEFAEDDYASTGVVQVMEERSLLQAVLAETLTPAVGVGSVRVIIGGEGRWDELRACSMILARYGVHKYATGTLGVVGPIRMRYGRAVSAVRFVADLLGELVYETYQPGAHDVFTEVEVEPPSSQ